jgi:hypothetical protein
MRRAQFSLPSFDPDTLRALYAAFDNAWQGVKADTDASNRDAVRDRIALAIIGQARAGETNVARLTALAIAQSRTRPRLFLVPAVGGSELRRSARGKSFPRP